MQIFLPLCCLHSPEGEEEDDEDGDGGSNNNKLHCNQDYSQNKVINSANFKSHCYIDARMLSDKLLFISDTNATTEELPSHANSNIMSSNDHQQTNTGMLKLIFGTLSYQVFSALYEDFNQEISRT